jgi:energy-converting hydrogenase Eha subunit A
VGPEEFQRALITVVVVGTIVIAIGATAIVLMMRSFGKKPGGTSHILIVAGLLGFILLCCAALFALSYFEAR